MLRFLRIGLGAILVGLLVPAGAAAATRTFLMTFSGFQYETYKASDNTAFDTQAHGLVGCEYTQDGDTTVDWKDVWRMKVDVKPRTGHARITSIKAVSGPRDRKNPGDSEISGANSNAPDSTQCSDEKFAGTFDCTAEAVTPRWITRKAPKPTFTLVDRAWNFVIPSYGIARASYSGDAPPKYGCKNRIGRNQAPGGFVAQDFGLGTTYAQQQLARGRLTGLKVGQHLTGDGLAVDNEPGWVDQEFPEDGDDCSAENTDEVCTYSTGTSASGDLVIKRTG